MNFLDTPLLTAAYSISCVERKEMCQSVYAWPGDPNSAGMF